MQFPIIIGLHRSFLLRWMPRLLAAACALYCLFLPFPALWCLALLLVVLLMSLRRQSDETCPLSSLRLEEGGGLVGIDRDTGDELALSLLPGVFAHPLLCVLPVIFLDGKKQRLIFTVDSASTADFRRLRLWLRQCAQISAPGGDA